MQPIDPQPSLVLFDLDDTLCDYASARLGRLKIAFSLALSAAERSGDVDLDQLACESIEIQPHGIGHFRSLFASHGIDDVEAVKKAETWFVNHRFHGLQLYPDAIETLNVVKAGLPHRRLGLVSNGPADVQRDKIELLGLDSYFDVVVISDEVGVAKPDPAIFTEALRLANSSARDAVFIGDSPEFDMAGAYASDIRSIWVNRERLEWMLPLPKPEWEVSDLRSLQDLLQAPVQNSYPVH
jgi:HAD superfamily hydrolase (TIGR01549 family)